MTVAWKDWLIPDPPVASQNAVREAEVFGITFPADYRAVATVRQGAVPDPSSFRLPDGAGVDFGYLLHFEESSPHSNIVARRWIVEDVLPEKVVPIADSSGNLWCLDFRADANHATIAYWLNDGGVSGPLTVAADSPILSQNSVDTTRACRRSTSSIN